MTGAATRKARRTYCRACNVPTLTGLDADRAGIPITLNLRPLSPAECAAAWPNVYTVFQGQIHELNTPRLIQAWETCHSTHRCEEAK